MDAYTRCCKCGKQNFYKGGNVKTEKCDCGNETFDCDISNKKPNWWVDEKKEKGP